MSKITPIIKKNLIYVKRNLFKTLLQLFYPTFYIIFFISIGFNRLNKISEKTYEGDISSIDMKSENSFEMIKLYGQDLAIIGRNSTLTNQLQDYAQNIAQICQKENDCKIREFQDLANFTEYLMSKSYESENTSQIGIALQYQYDNSTVISFSISSNSLKVTSQWTNLNPFRLIPDKEKLMDVPIWKEYQLFISKFLLYSSNCTVKRNLVITSLPMKSPEIKPSIREDFIAVIPSILSMTYLSTLFQFVLWLVMEKEKKLTDLLSRQGVSTYEYYLSWHLTYLLLSLIPLALNTFLVCYYVLTSTHFVYVFLTLLFFSWNLIAMALVLYQLVDDVRSGQTLLKVVYIGVSLLGLVVRRPEISMWVKYIFSIFPQMVLTNAFEILLQADNFPKGMDMNLMLTNYQGCNMMIIFIVYIFDFLFYTLVAYFIESYTRSGMKFCDFITSHFAKRENHLTQQLEIPVLIEDKCNYNIFFIAKKVQEDALTKNIFHEEIMHEDLIQQEQNGECLTITKITKKFGELTAVNDFSCKLFNNQIFVLLGHNGAGKTTLVKIISGLEDPNNGDIFLQKRSLLTDKDFLFRNIGLCSQEDIYFENLTVQEHLEIMSQLKGAEKDMNEINDLLTRIDLYDKKDDLASTLSGGQKRKLCIALALIGNSKLILLDEPTSGMDVTAKKALWKFLKWYKTGKIVLLTTHSLEEADYLGDRIGIMTEGQFVCSGTSSYLKNQYSCGFNISFILDHTQCSKSDRNGLIEGLKQIEPNAMTKVLSKEILVMNFPDSGTNIKEIFEYIEQIRKKCQIVNYTLSTTSLEDVFLKLNSNEFSKNLFNTSNEVECNNDNNNSEVHDNPFIPCISGANQNQFNVKKIGFFSELCLHSKRNLLGVWRNKKSFILEIIACSITFFIYIFGFSYIFNAEANVFQSFFGLLENGRVLYQKDSSISDNIAFSYFLGGKESEGMKFAEAGKLMGRDITELDRLFFSQSYYHNEKSLFYIRAFNSSVIEIYNLYHSAAVDFHVAVNDILISSYLKNEHGIDTKMISSYSRIPMGSKASFQDDRQVALLIISNILLVSSFINLSGYMIITPLRERLINVKHLLYLSGVNMLNYWISLLLVDLVKYAVFMILIYPCLLYVDTGFVYTFILGFFYMISSLLFAYAFSFLFGTEENGQKFYLMTSYLGLCVFVALVAIHSPEYLTCTDISFSWGDVFSPATLALGMVRIWTIIIQNKFGLKVPIQNVIYSCLFAFSIQGTIYGFFLYLFDRKLIEFVYYKLFKRLFKSGKISTRQVMNNENRDIDIDNHNLENNQQNKSYISIKDHENGFANKERENIINDDSSKFSVKIKGLTKIYSNCCAKNTIAVDNLSLGLEPNEKFGLLGFNGSGKSTTFKSITDEIFFDSGTIEIFNHNIEKSFNVLRNIMGYCPQSNALFDFLTVEETFLYYLQIKGNVNQHSNVSDIMKKFGLEHYRNTITTNLSGGNKRKLNFAVALMNNPKLVLLDEPSTGVDPESRRIMWKNINDIPKAVKTFNMILSTHSMEEAEILCDSIGWMKNGNFVCVGNPERLRISYSKGYYLQIKFTNPERSHGLIEINEDMIVKRFSELGSYLDGFDITLLVNLVTKKGNGAGAMDQVYGYEKLENLSRKIRPLCNGLKLVTSASPGNSFELLMSIPIENQSAVFASLLSLKTLDPGILEINIRMESLENIFTSL